MIDIEFYMKVGDLKRRLKAGEKFSREELQATLEAYRSPLPVAYNIETTNACNMRCEMCPRTTMMTRPVETMKPELFKSIIDQLQPFSAEQLARWEDFAEGYYNRGLTHLFLGNNKQGIADLSKAGELGIVSAYNVIKRFTDTAQ